MDRWTSSIWTYDLFNEILSISNSRQEEQSNLQLFFSSFILRRQAARIPLLFDNRKRNRRRREKAWTKVMFYFQLISFVSDRYTSSSMISGVRMKRCSRCRQFHVHRHARSKQKHRVGSLKIPLSSFFWSTGETINVVCVLPQAR